MVSLKSLAEPKRYSGYFARLIHKKPIVPPAPVYHSHTTIKNNFNMGIRFTAVLQRRLSILRQNYPEGLDPLWFIFGRPSSHYEWYVQKSMLRDVRNAYRELVYYTRDLRDATFREQKPEGREGKTQHRPLSHLTPPTIPKLDFNRFQRFPELKQRKTPEIYNYPKLRYPETRHQSPIVSPSARTSEYSTESNIKIDRQVEQLRKEINDIRSDFHNDRNLYNMVNINSILDQVYSGIEEKLKRQRLKKGF
ncbi:MAG: hypothetical protein FWE27_00105 [Defluviitaleaceae bacterium]|nr:hypothetical protein [Defluviitaleaceae bacterium]